MPTRTARTGWTGTLEQGSGKVELTSSHLGTYEMSFPKRTAEEANGATSPEELIAAAHSACFTMALSKILGEAQLTAEQLDTSAQVTLESVDGGFAITAVHLTLKGKVPGATPAQFVELANKAKAGCPMSKLLKADISLDAQLVG